MRQSVLLLFTCLLSASAYANTIVDYTLTSLGGNSYRYNYTFVGLDLLANQELAIQFDPTKYSTLSNGVAGPGFDLALFQPNQPPGSVGEYSLLALVDHPATTGTFSVNFVYTGPGLPGAQAFVISDDNFTPIHILQSGTTASLTPIAPEPSTALLGCSAFLLTGAGLAVRRRRSKISSE